MIWLEYWSRREVDVDVDEMHMTEEMPPSSKSEEENDDLCKPVSKLPELDTLSVENLAQFPSRKVSIVSQEEEYIEDHHKHKLGLIWSVCLVCGLCYQWRDTTCSLRRHLSSPLETVSLLLTLPVPAVLAVCPYMVCLCLGPKYNNQITSITSNRTYLLLYFCYFLTILPSLLVDLVDTDNDTQVVLIMLVKYSLASLHIIFEPIVLLCSRPDVSSAVKDVFFKRQKTIESLGGMHYETVNRCTKLGLALALNSGQDQAEQVKFLFQRVPLVQARDGADILPDIVSPEIVKEE